MSCPLQPIRVFRSLASRDSDDLCGTTRHFRLWSRVCGDQGSWVHPPTVLPKASLYPTHPSKARIFLRLWRGEGRSCGDDGGFHPISSEQSHRSIYGSYHCLSRYGSHPDSPILP